jgi:hypothetical protein
MKTTFDHHDTPLPTGFYNRKYNISRSTLWLYRNAGLTSIRVGTKLFIRESEFVAFLQKMNGQTVNAMSGKSPTNVSL